MEGEEVYRRRWWILAVLCLSVVIGKGPYQPRLVGTFKEIPNKAEHPGLMTERAGPVMNSNQLRSSERS